MTALHRVPMRPPAAPATHSLEAPAEASAPGGIGLALGGGFARGFAHLGVLQVLEENRIPISCIAGTSIGSILGAAYASGVPLERIAAIGRTIRFRDFARWRISRLGLASNDRMAELIHRWFRALTFEELRIPTAVVATDLGTGEPVVFTRGGLVDAIRASCAYPGLFEPVYLGGQCLADGALVAPVPTRAAAEMGAACVVGVCVCADAWTGEAPKNLFQIFTRAIAVAQKDQGDSWRGMAQLVIEPAVQHIDWDQFGRADEAVAAGISAARQVLPLIQNLPRPLSPSQTTGLPQPAGTTGGTTAEMLP